MDGGRECNMKKNKEAGGSSKEESTLDSENYVDAHGSRKEKTASLGIRDDRGKRYQAK